LYTLPATISCLDNLRQLKLANNFLVSLPPTFSLLKGLEVFDVVGNENLQSPPYSVCLDGLSSIFEYLENTPQTVEEMQEGWEIVEPTPIDESILFDLTDRDTAPYVPPVVPIHPQHYETQPALPDDQASADSSGWVSYMLSFLFPS
jgi:hypothetical protein